MSSGIALTSLGCVARASDAAKMTPAASHDPAATAEPAHPDARVAATAGEHAAAAPPERAPIDTTLDPRSAANIATLLPAAQRAARHLLAAANDGRLGPGVMVKVICGTRTYAEQTALYAQGRTAPGPIVTDAPAGYSNHNFGIAFDVGIFVQGEYQDDSPLYAKVGALGRTQGLEWGGDWTSFPDRPHFQLAWSGSLAEARALIAAGTWSRLWAAS